MALFKGKKKSEPASTDAASKEVEGGGVKSFLKRFKDNQSGESSEKSEPSSTSEASTRVKRLALGQKKGIVVGENGKEGDTPIVSAVSIDYNKLVAEISAAQTAFMNEQMTAIKTFIEEQTAKLGAGFAEALDEIKSVLRRIQSDLIGIPADVEFLLRGKSEEATATKPPSRSWPPTEKKVESLLAVSSTDESEEEEKIAEALVAYITRTGKVTQKNELLKAAQEATSCTAVEAAAVLAALLDQGILIKNMRAYQVAASDEKEETEYDYDVLTERIRVMIENEDNNNMELSAEEWADQAAEVLQAEFVGITGAMCLEVMEAIGMLE